MTRAIRIFDPDTSNNGQHAEYRHLDAPVWVLAPLAGSCREKMSDTLPLVCGVQLHLGVYSGYSPSRLRVDLLAVCSMQLLGSKSEPRLGHQGLERFF